MWRKASPATSVLSFLLLGAIGIAGYFYYQYKHTPSVMEREEIESLVMKVSKAMEVPTGEIPTLATVTNKERLDDQPFFKRAENGDKILIYSESGRAILYRPSIEKIIDVTTVNIATEQVANPLVPEMEEAPPAPESESIPAPEETVMEEAPLSEPVLAPEAVVESATIALYNGTAKVGMTNDVEVKITGVFPSVTVEKKEKAARKDYAQTVVVDLSGKHALLTTDIARELNGMVETALPVGEINPGTDVLVIVGNE